MSNETTEHRNLLVVRHGERIDFTFNTPVNGYDWISKAFDSNGVYRRFNVNMPRILPSRKDGFENYAKDSPLTEIGYLQAKIVGRSMKDAGINLSAVYCSPAYRCVQTAVGLLKGMHSTTKCLRIEPSLFEWCGWFKPHLPLWFAPSDFVRQSHPIDEQYQPFLTASQLTVAESLLDYYNRSYIFTKHALEENANEKGDVLLVSHGASLDACTRFLVGGAMRTQAEFYGILEKTPYLSVGAVRQRLAEPSQWEVCEAPVLPFAHTPNSGYDWRIMQKYPDH